MHIKHYHPEYNKFMGSTPNVADLAYARTIGEPVEDIVPKSRYSVKSPAFLEKINRFEATRKVKVGEMVLSDKKKAPLFKEKVTTISPTVKRTLKEYLYVMYLYVMYLCPKIIRFDVLIEYSVLQ